MAKDPAFLFYPGDYLRDTQCLSESVQVAYDRIMCEHMRNICITQQQLNFFTKRLTKDQKDELLQVLTKTLAGFQIQWVAESIEKRRNYSDSRRKNREGHKKEPKNISKSYVSHMENENENENVIVNNKKESKIIFPFDSKQFKTAWDAWVSYRNEIKKPYRSDMSRQAALKTLSKYSEQTAIQMIEQSIANGWQGLFEIKSNGHTKNKRESTAELAAAFAERVRNDAEKRKLQGGE